MPLSFGTIAAIISPVLSALLAWVITRRKSTAEVRKIEAEAQEVEIGNVESVVKIWQKIAEDLGLQVSKLTAEVSSLRKENYSLKIEMQRLEKIIQENIKNHHE